MFLVRAYTLSAHRPRLGGLFVWRVGETLPTRAPFWNIYLLMYFIFDCVAASSFSFSQISGFWGKKSRAGNALPPESRQECERGNPLIDRLQPTEAIGQELVDRLARTQRDTQSEE